MRETFEFSKDCQNGKDYFYNNLDVDPLFKVYLFCILFKIERHCFKNCNNYKIIRFRYMWRYNRR